MTISNPAVETQKGHHRLNPFISTILERTCLNKAGSSKRTFHISLNIQQSEITFKPGDSVGIYPENLDQDVDALLSKLGCKGSESIQTKKTKESISLRDYLQKHANLQKITQKISDSLEIAHDPAHDVISAACSSQANMKDLQTFCDALLPLAPRFYSVASSSRYLPGQIDLLVATFSYFHGNRMQEGLGSSYLCKTAIPGTTPIRIFVQSNDSFILPIDSSKPIIMIGPGTGVAPFRAFLQERLHHGSTGKNWLFFGERNRKTDFYYEDFFTSLQKSNRLKLTTAFSRDQDQKYYVQNAMKEHAEELYQWIQEGSLIYVCGDAKNMAKDVFATLAEILSSHGNMSETEAQERLKTMRKQGQLLQDIY